MESKSKNNDENKTKKTFLDITKENNLTESETIEAAYYFTIMKAKNKGISPTQLLAVINNYHKLQAIFLKQ